MTSPVTLPFWLFVILAILAAIAIVDRIFAPGVRWYFRRRVNDAIDELNTRLDLRIQPFKLAHRESLVDQLLYDHGVIDAVEAEHEETGKPRSVLMKEVTAYAREIVPTFSPLAYFGFGTRAARWLSEFVYRVRLGYADDAALRNIPPEAAVVFVMNHRSNMDYVLVTYMASTRASLSYAVGEWARIWLLQSIFRSMGAYFIRRKSNNTLYRRVLAAYVRKATDEGVTQAVFPEGGLSRNGKLGDAKLGLLSYMVGGFNPAVDRDIVFIPVGINYDRVLEDRILTAKTEKERTGRDFSVSPTTVLGFIGHLLKLRLQGKLYRYGHACVSFGKPLSLKAFAKENRLDFSNVTPPPVKAGNGRPQPPGAVEKLGNTLLEEIGTVIPVLPVALVATVMLENQDHQLGELELKSRVFDLMTELLDNGAHLHIPRHDRDYTLTTGIRMLTLRHLIIHTRQGLYRINPDEILLLQYYANSIAHLRKPPGKPGKRTEAKAAINRRKTAKHMGSS
ncbi:1-acyl-sn-glycerol-3-phosphate acyltransferase [Salaquimonas pukyongi]|uniref:1-acyl-sn-glycerol-3-phosphate acyltransferase n=1 Tax=Salaquimonas pukyongi TaxID=2712698 RepID=UPI0013BEA49C|nr:1-acyl-sn-glycerol-3-phosphate acyltransferase [Salaquimonas pukyongi]